MALAASEQRQVSPNELSLLQVSFAKETCKYYWALAASEQRQVNVRSLSKLYSVKKTKTLLLRETNTVIV